MAERITKAGRELLAFHQGNGSHCDIDKFILAYVPGQDPSDEIDPDRGLPSGSQIVHEQAVTRDGYLAPNMVTYSLYMDAKTGTFTFNTIYTVSTVNSNTVMQIITVPDTPKIADDIGNNVRGQPMVRNAVLVYDDAAAITNITIEAEAWQWDFEDATEEVKGFIEIATQSEVDTGTDHERAVTPKTLKSRLASFIRNASETNKGFVEIATQDEANSSDNDSRVLTAKKLYNRTATESRRGVAELATQTEADAGTDDSRIITPKKLWALLTAKFARKDIRPTFSEGINTGGKPIVYSGSGTNVDHIWYDDGDNEFHLVADKEEGAAGNANVKVGGIQLGTGVRVTGVSDSATSTSKTTLATSYAVDVARDDGTRQATESTRGQAETATQAEVNAGTDHKRIVTPKTLASRLTSWASGLFKSAAYLDAGQNDGQVALIGDPKTNGRAAVIVASGSNANGSYRIWSDGFKEQFGLVTISNKSQPVTVTYPVAFSSFIAIWQTPDTATTGSGYSVWHLAQTKTNTSVQMTTNSSAAQSAFWFAKGY